MNKTFLILFLSVFSYEIKAEHFSSSGGVNRQSTEGVESRILPNLVTFYSTLGVVPSIKLNRISANASDGSEQKKNWERNLESWSILTQRQINDLDNIIANEKNETRKTFKKGLSQIRQQLSEGVHRANLDAGKEDPLGSLAGQVISNEARKISDEILTMLIEFGNVLSRQPELQENKQQALREAHRAVKSSFPQSELTRYTASDLKGLNAHHRTQVTELLRLRDSLYSNGNFLPLVVEMSEGNRQPIGLSQAASVN